MILEADAGVGILGKEVRFPFLLAFFFLCRVLLFFQYSYLSGSACGHEF